MWCCRPVRAEWLWSCVVTVAFCACRAPRRALSASSTVTVSGRCRRRLAGGRFHQGAPTARLAAESGGGSLGGPRIPPNQSLVFSFPATAGGATRWLNVDAVALPDGQTGVRVDAQVAIVGRHERVPRDAGVLRISWKDSRKPTTMVTNRETIRAVARAVDQYPLSADGVCGEGFVPPSITFSFLRSRDGPVLARVSGVTNGAPDAFCEPTLLWVRGRGSQLLVEDSGLLDEVTKSLRTRLR